MKSIGDVIQRLGRIVDQAAERDDPVGLFAALYRTVTERVAHGIEAGDFEDGLRMERLDVAFAGRYLDAFDAWEGGQPTTHSWATAMSHTREWRPIVLQHLLGGMNAHINLDLGIAAATIAPGESLASLRNDFMAINGVLASLVQGTKDALIEVWPPLRWIDRIGGSADDAIVNFSMSMARDGAWEFAEQLAALSMEEWPGVIEARDRIIGGEIADLIYRPGTWATGLLLLVRLGERGTTTRKIGYLAARAASVAGAPA